MPRRAFVVVLDACGVGALPDAAAYGDEGSDTLGHLAFALGGLELPNLGGLGLGSIASIAGVPPAAQPVLHGRLHALGPGKDSTAGHRELMGVVTRVAPPTYPAGFPPEILAVLRRASGREVVGNLASNGIAAIAALGAEHLASGALIVYTSQDSVLQIAGHVDRVPPEELYAICAAVRLNLPAEHAVGRVIARPFTGEPGAFARTDGRRDYALPPPGRSYLQEVQAAGLSVHAVGKVDELFTAEGIDVRHPGATNAQAIASIDALVGELEAGLVFANLVETDQVYAHRRDLDGFHRALRNVDAAVGRWLPRLGAGDLLVLTADHGCDPTTPGTDHTREHAPLLAHYAGHGGRRWDGPLADVGASVLAWLAGRAAPELPGTSWWPVGHDRPLFDAPG